eukprot:Sspe_Gene.38777::Locus_18703_Transcript_1_1_Confidence_1.000_Length_1759::g.38777::m.38777
MASDDEGLGALPRDELNELPSPSRAKDSVATPRAREPPDSPVPVLEVLNTPAQPIISIPVARPESDSDSTSSSSGSSYTTSPLSSPSCPTTLLVDPPVEKVAKRKTASTAGKGAPQQAGKRKERGSTAAQQGGSPQGQSSPQGIGTSSPRKDVGQGEGAEEERDHDHSEILDEAVFTPEAIFNPDSPRYGEFGLFTNSTYRADVIYPDFTFSGLVHNATRLPHGYGTKTYNNNSALTCEQWINGIPNGKGLLISSNGDKFFGYWLNGHRHGKGVLRRERGGVYVEVYRDGTRVRRVTIEKGPPAPPPPPPPPQPVASSKRVSPIPRASSPRTRRASPATARQPAAKAVPRKTPLTSRADCNVVPRGQVAVPAKVLGARGGYTHDRRPARKAKDPYTHDSPPHPVAGSSSRRGYRFGRPALAVGPKPRPGSQWPSTQVNFPLTRAHAHAVRSCHRAPLDEEEEQLTLGDLLSQ